MRTCTWVSRSLFVVVVVGVQVHFQRLVVAVVLHVHDSLGTGSQGVSERVSVNVAPLGWIA